VGYIEVVAVGDVEMGTLSIVERGIAGPFGYEARRGRPVPPPESAFEPARSQHDSSAFLARVLAAKSAASVRILGVTEADLFIPMLTFVYGQAQLAGSAAIISLARLRQEFYGLPPDPDLLAERAVKEALHELGHTFGLVHCPDPSCAASLSTHVLRLDAKRAEFCRVCAALLNESLSSLDRTIQETAGMEETT